MSPNTIKPNRENTAMRSHCLHVLLRLALAVLALTLWGCDESLQETDGGGVYLVVEFQTSPAIVGVNDQERLLVPSLVINSIIVNPAAATSDLMDVELSTMEVTFTRADTGTRVPVPYVVQLLGTVDSGGTLTYNNIPVMGVEQMRAVPLSDLLFENGAVDKETDNEYIRLNLNVRVFGRTLGGEEVASRLRGETIEFVPSLLTSF